MKKNRKKILEKARKDQHSAYWKRKALILWGKIIRGRDGKCLYCGSKLNLNAHHLLCKERYPMYMFDLDNGFTLCCKHHKRGNPSAHTHGIWYSLFLRIKFPKILALTEKRVYNYGKLDKKINYFEEFNRLLEIYNAETDKTKKLPGT